jgi:hypothetical protein
MDYAYLEDLKKHPAWRLLKADNAPFIISFFHSVFVSDGVPSYSQTQLIGRFDDHRYALKELIAESLPRPALDYLNEWAKGENAYLRRFYPDRVDEPWFELTSATETAIEWLSGLKRRAFVGTESRLMAMFQLLREILQFTQGDPALRLATLERRKLELDQQIESLKSGSAPRADPTRVKERYFQLEDMARRLFADFRQVEENFRELDRRTREKIAVSDLAKGQLLDQIFNEEHAIADSDEGRSFRAFWEFLLSASRQQELQELTGALLNLEALREVSEGAALPHLKVRLLESGSKVKRTLDSLSDHLRRFLDDRAWLENRRIMDLIRSIERRAVDLADHLPQDQAFAHLDEAWPTLHLSMARGLAQPLAGTALLDSVVGEGLADFGSELLYNVHFVDELELRERIREALEEASQVSLDQLCALYPLKKGLSELVTYLNIAGLDEGAWFDPEVRRGISWRDAQGMEKAAVLPQVIFTRPQEYPRAEA